MTKEKLEKELIRIAREKVVSMEDREDLECHKNGEEDFFEIAIFELKNVMLAAYELGKKDSEMPTKASKPADGETGWKKGILDAVGEKVDYWAKVYEEPSEFGINGGRISKLMLKHNGTIILNYDRGWDVKPTDEISKAAYQQILKMYN